MKNNPKITILGDGSWGTTVALLLAQKNYDVILWGPFPDNLEAIKKDGQNKKYLPDVKLPANILAVADLSQAVGNADIIVLGIPSKFIRGILKQLAKIQYPKNGIYLSLIKGLEDDSGSTVSTMVDEELGQVKFAVLSGPTIACDVAHGQACQAEIASADPAVLKELKDIFSSTHLTASVTSDVVGVELGGSLKNVLALGYGIVCGLTSESILKTDYLNMGLKEAKALALKMGALPKTLDGPSWHDDLIVTCKSKDSRNRQVGEALAKGKQIKEIIKSMNMVAEGVETISAVIKLAQKHNAELPLISIIDKIIKSQAKPIVLLEYIQANR